MRCTADTRCSVVIFDSLCLENRGRSVHRFWAQLPLFPRSAKAICPRAVSCRCRSGSIHQTPVVPVLPWAFCYCREVFDIPVTVVGHRTRHPRIVRIETSAHSTHEQSVSKSVSKPSTPRIVLVLAPGRRSNNRADWLQTITPARSTLHYITLHILECFWNFFHLHIFSRSIICRLVRPSVFRRPDSLAINLTVLFFGQHKYLTSMYKILRNLFRYLNGASIIFL